MTEDPLVPSVSNCPNCGQTLSATANFCSSCGQKHTTGKVTVRMLTSEFLDTILHFDSRLYRTLRALFIPGRLTTQFFAGKHQSYLRPIRLFFTCTLLLIAVLSFTVMDDLRDELTSSSPYQTFKQRHTFHQAIDKVVERYQQDSIAVTEMRAIDTFTTDLRKEVGTGSWSTGLILSDASVTVPAEDLFTLPTDSLMAKYGIENWFDRLVARQVIKSQKTPDRFFNFALGNVTWMMILLIPALALFMKLFYLRRRRYYVEHVVFLFHYHAAAFLVLSLYIGLLNFLPLVLKVAVPVACVIFLFAALKRYYDQGFFKTTIKLFLLFFAYVFTLAVFAAGTFMFSFLFFR